LQHFKKVWYEAELKQNSIKYTFEVSTGKFLGLMINKRGISAKLEKVKAFFRDIKHHYSERSLKTEQLLAVLRRFVSSFV